MNAEDQMATDRPSGHVRSNGVRFSVARSEELPAWSTLIKAVNFYVSTSDVVGEGMFVERKGTRWLVIPVHTGNPVDVRDLGTLESRVSELPAEWGVRLERFEEVPTPAGVDFSYLNVPERRVDEVSRALLEQPGALGWGSLVDHLESCEDLESKVASLQLPFVPMPVCSELVRRIVRRAVSELR